MGVIRKIETGKLFSNLLRLFLYFLFIFYLGKNVQKCQKKGRFWAKWPKDVSTDGSWMVNKTGGNFDWNFGQKSVIFQFSLIIFSNLILLNLRSSILTGQNLLRLILTNAQL